MELYGRRGLLVKGVDEDKRLVFGWAYIARDANGRVVVDKQGDFIDDLDVLEKAAYDFVHKTRAAGVMHERRGSGPRVVGEMVESLVTTPEKLEKMGLKGRLPEGWWVGFRVEDDSVWRDVKAGRFKGFSIHGSGRRKRV